MHQCVDTGGVGVVEEQGGGRVGGRAEVRDELVFGEAEMGAVVRRGGEGAEVDLLLHWCGDDECRCGWQLRGLPVEERDE